MNSRTTFIESINSIATSPLREAVTDAYQAIFEANAGNELKRAVNILCQYYGVSDHAEARRIAQDFRHMVFDIFTTNQHEDPSRDPAVVKVLGLFEPALRLFCDNNDITGNCMQAMAKFGQHFRGFISEHGDSVKVDVTADPSTGRQAKSMKLDGRVVTMDDIMSADTVSSSSLSVPARVHKYKIIHVPTHEYAVENFQGKVPWCLTWDDASYWAKYSDSGSSKCYFVFRDDFQFVDNGPNSRPNDPEDEYGLTAIGLFVDGDGDITHLFNRHNRVDHIYSADDMAKLVGRPFDEAFPPFTESEREESIEACANDGFEPITRNNFYSQLARLAERQMEQDVWEGMYNCINDLAESVWHFAWSDHTGDELEAVTIRDTQDGQLYTTVLLEDCDAYDIDGMTYDYMSGWEPCSSDNVLVYGNNLDGRVFSTSTPVVVVGNVLLDIDEKYDSHEWDMPEGYHAVSISDDKECDCVYNLTEHGATDEDYNDRDGNEHPIAIPVRGPDGKLNLLVIPQGRADEPFLFLENGVNKIELRYDEDAVAFVTDDDTDLFYDKEIGGVMTGIAYDEIRAAWLAGKPPYRIDEEDDADGE